MDTRQLDEIVVKGFRRLRDVELRTSTLSVLIGANGSGKTSFLDVWSLLAAACQGRLTDKLSDMGGLGDQLTSGRAKTLYFSLRMTVPARAPLEYELEIGQQGGGQHRIVREVLKQQNDPHSLQPFKHIDASGPLVKYFDEQEKKLMVPTWDYNSFETALGQIPKMYREPEDFRKQLASCTYYGPLDVGSRAPVRLPQKMQPAALPGRQGEDLVSALYFMRETNRDRYEVLEDTLKTAFGDFERLDFPPVAAGLMTMTWKDRRFSKPMYLHQLSEGTLRFIWLAALLLSDKLTAVTLIDEPEVSLHPELLRLLVDLLRDASERTLLLVATHSDRLVRFLKPEEVVVADIDDDGETRLERGDRLGLDRWLADYSLDELWAMGRLGGRS